MSKPEKSRKSADSRPAQKFKALPLKTKVSHVNRSQIRDVLKRSNRKLPASNSQNWRETV